MPVTQQLTYEEIRTAIGSNLGTITSTMTAAESTANEVVDGSIPGGSGEHAGKWIVYTSGTNDGRIRRVVSSTVSSNVHTMTVLPTTTALAATSSGDTYELWPEPFDPNQILRFANQAIFEVTGRAFDPVEDITLRGDGVTARFDIPATFEMVHSLAYRSYVRSRVIDEASSEWSEGTNVTTSIDTELQKRGQSNKIAIGAVSAGAVVAYRDITSIDISKYTHVEWWMRSSFTTTAADYKLLLDDTAGSGSPLELLDVPALTADTWTPIRVALAVADTDTAIISVGLEDDVGDNDSQTVWIDYVEAVDQESAVWTPVPHHMWHIDKEARDLVLDREAVSFIGESPIKLRGGDNPIRFSADSDVSEVDDQYIIAKTTGLALMTRATDGTNKGIANARQGAFWLNQAQRLSYKFPLLVNARMVT